MDLDLLDGEDRLTNLRPVDHHIVGTDAIVARVGGVPVLPSAAVLRVAADVDIITRTTRTEIWFLNWTLMEVMTLLQTSCTNFVAPIVSCAMILSEPHLISVLCS